MNIAMFTTCLALISLVTGLEFCHSDMAHVTTPIGLIKGLSLHSMLSKGSMFTSFILPWTHKGNYSKFQPICIGVAKPLFHY